MAREFTLPTTRTFGVGGTARISATGARRDPRRAARPDRQRGGRGAGNGVVTATSSRRCRDRWTRGRPRRSTAIPKTAWTNAFGGNLGSWVQIHSATPTTISKFNLQVIADGKHSVPTTHRRCWSTAASRSASLHLPAVADRKAEDSVVSAPVSFAPVTGSTFRLVVTGRAARDHHRLLQPPPARAAGRHRRDRRPGLRSPRRREPAKRLPHRPAEDRRQPGRVAGRRIHRGGDRPRRPDLQLCGKPLTLRPARTRCAPRVAASPAIDLDRLHPVVGSRRRRRCRRRSPSPGGPHRDDQGLGRPQVTVTGEGPGRLPALGQRRHTRQAVLAGARPEPVARLARRRRRASATSASRNSSTATPTAG